MKLTDKDRKTIARTKNAGVLVVSLTALLTVTVSQSAAREASQHQRQSMPKTIKAVPVPQPYQPPQIQRRELAPTAQLGAQEILANRIRDIGRSFNGDIGIAVQDVQTGWTTHYDGNTYFPQQSVSKFWVALTALDRADRGHLTLDAPVTVTRDDLTLFHQPIAQQVGTSGYRTTLNALMKRAIQQSDNTCNDFILWKAGGPEAVRSFLADKRISGIRFGPGERSLQSRIAGMEWKSSFVGSAFYKARAALPMSVRRTAFENYIRDPMDGATPLATVDALARLKRGELLSPQSTRKLLDIMGNTRTGAQRLKGGLAPGWKLAHKTGTGQVLGGTQAGYNDIGIVTAPDGRSYAVAVLIRRTAAPLPHRMQAMQNTVRAIVNYSDGLPGQAFTMRKSPPRPAVQPAAVPVSRTQAIAATVQSLSDEAAAERD